MAPNLRRAAAAIALALAACVPPVPSNDIVQEYAETTAMGIIQRTGVLRVGLERDAFPLGADREDPAGFTYEIGAELAESLGVRAEFVVAPAAELAALVEDGDLDVAFPLTPVTEKAVGRHAYSDPWWVGHQRLLAGIDGVEGLEDLAGRAVCDAPDPATGIPLADLQPAVGTVVKRPDPRACAPDLSRGRVDVVSGPDVWLMSLAARASGKLVGDAQTTAGYGAITSREAVGLNGFVDLVLREIDSEGRWEAWYEEYVSPVTGTSSPGIPLMTIEEAAALYPK
ncbi:MAG TPA: transporter substrate-binding domain-containing protein [Actinomycetota bacterium]|jgi:ABC-type amino acid transport substrate-binding protein|nr:transporter substrate-binding domain-containing protein [Actinomycetota bacterium]